MAWTPKILSPTRLLVPRRAVGKQGELGDGMVEIGPTDPEWSDWVETLQQESPAAAAKLAPARARAQSTARVCSADA